MIDAEKLLSKVLAGAMQSSTGKKKKKKKRKKSDDLMGGVLGGLTSGKGLVTAIGLGIGAYEILKNKTPATTQGQTPPAPQTPQNTIQSQAVPPSPSAAAPPPLPGSQVTPPAPAWAPGTAKEPPAESISQAAEQELAVRLIQTMVAAAHADGDLDSDEEMRILEKLQQQGLEKEEKQFLLAQLQHPKGIDELVSDINDPLMAQTMYSLAASTIIVDTAEERQWLDQLASALTLSENVKQFIEKEL